MAQIFSPCSKPKKRCKNKAAGNLVAKKKAQGALFSPENSDFEGKNIFTIQIHHIHYFSVSILTFGCDVIDVPSHERVTTTAVPPHRD